ncbi:MAG: putative transporter component containing two sulfur transport domain [Candidatus Methanohalarchaeum thermophilum]|uniref:Transporter component containing two sulfur transport domain n=1 Tax=Methanohalarchaeum thermophilum TaxID=1903181 RepID=A0A1Q6DXF1_METT1|nr:MAG: putative transporter component containing two sulfur transport domain [Candidatus Methanohalarchaeum thermophilum]
MSCFFLARWSPWLVGVGIGVLVWLGFLFSNRAIGCSTAYARTGGILESFIRGKRVKDREYFKKFSPIVDWEWMLVLGVGIGSFFSAILSGQFKMEIVPVIWSNTFGRSIILRLVAALLGGVFIGFGSRLAGGCTSGHGISGSSQLALSSWLAFILFFTGGIATAMFLFNFIGGV